MRLTEALTLDGRLDERVYGDVPSLGDFVQQEPVEGVPATERTEVWLFFDEANLYVAARCWDSQPDRIVANEMRRDNDNIQENDHLSVAIDTFRDRRNGVLFHTNPIGGIYDALITDETNTNSDWNTIWDVKTGRFGGGWTVEMVIPFQSLRYRQSGEQVWGFNVGRTVRRKNERSYLTAVPRAWKEGGINKLSLAATLEGLSIPRGSRLREVKPYAISGVLTDESSSPPRVNKWTRDIGGDLKYGLTRGLTLDLTVNTDFAQVESDEQQVNLTRFSLFFPEKREFFLEGQGIFSFAGNGGGRADTPLLFFSRRIGLNGNETVPIQVGARVSGRTGPYSMGFLSIRQNEADDASLPATTFSVARVKRNVGQRSTFGGILVHRSESPSGLGDSLAAGVDASVWLTPGLNASGYIARTGNADGSTGDSYRAQLDYTGDHFGYVFDYLVVDPDFNPEVGYVRRADVRRANGRLRYTQRPEIHWMRSQEYVAQLTYFTDTRGRLQNRDVEFSYELNFDSGDDIEVQYRRGFERLDEGFTVADVAFVPAGDYNAQEVQAAYEFGPQRRSGGELRMSRGTFYGGSLGTFEAEARLEITPRISLEPRIELNWIDLEARTFRTTLTGARLNYTVTPRMLVAALLQYNATDEEFESNLRLRWEFTPGSDIFVVFSEGRLTGAQASLQNRTFAVKVSRLLRF